MNNLIKNMRLKKTPHQRHIDGKNTFEKMFHVITGELQIKRTIRYHYTPSRMAKIQNADNTKCWWGCGTKITLIHCWQEYRTAQSLGNSLEVSYKTKHARWYLSVSCKLCPLKSLHKDVYRFIHDYQNLEVANTSFGRWMDKQTVVHPDNEIFLSAKKKWAIKPWKDMKEA